MAIVVSYERPARATKPKSVEDDLQRLHPASFGWALACCSRNHDEAQEVLQTVYLKVLDGRARFDGQSSVKTWLFATIRRTAAERRRSRLLRGLALSRFWAKQPEPAPAASPESALERIETSRGLLRALRSLSSRQRDVLHLVFYQDLTVEEAAEVIGISVGSARTHYQRGKDRLRALLATEGA